MDGENDQMGQMLSFLRTLDSRMTAITMAVTANHETLSSRLDDLQRSRTLSSRLSPDSPQLSATQTSSPSISSRPSSSSVSSTSTIAANLSQYVPPNIHQPSHLPSSTTIYNGSFGSGSSIPSLSHLQFNYNQGSLGRQTSTSGFSLPHPKSRARLPNPGVREAKGKEVKFGRFNAVLYIPTEWFVKRKTRFDSIVFETLQAVCQDHGYMVYPDVNNKQTPSEVQVEMVNCLGKKNVSLGSSPWFWAIFQAQGHNLLFHEDSSAASGAHLDRVYRTARCGIIIKRSPNDQLDDHPFVKEFNERLAEARLESAASKRSSEPAQSAVEDEEDLEDAMEECDQCGYRTSNELMLVHIGTCSMRKSKRKTRSKSAAVQSPLAQSKSGSVGQLLSEEHVFDLTQSPISVSTGHERTFDDHLEPLFAPFSEEEEDGLDDKERAEKEVAQWLVDDDEPDETHAASQGTNVDTPVMVDNDPQSADIATAGARIAGMRNLRDRSKIKVLIEQSSKGASVQRTLGHKRHGSAAFKTPPTASNASRRQRKTGSASIEADPQPRASLGAISQRGRQTKPLTYD